MTVPSRVERVAIDLWKVCSCPGDFATGDPRGKASFIRMASAAIAASDAALAEAGYAIVPKEPTSEMLVAARDWSLRKYEKAIGNDAAIGCWCVMWDAAPPQCERD